MTSKTIYWSGNLDSDPKAGIVEAESNGNLVVLWNDGVRQIVPMFVVTARHGWRVS